MEDLLVRNFVVMLYRYFLWGIFMAIMAKYHGATFGFKFVGSLLMNCI
jgi:hypothetical protein